jgi:hypothetical protein
MEEQKEKLSRKGIHKYIHVSKLDTYIYAVLSVGFFAFVAFKVLNKLLDLEMATPIVTWVNALQLAILWAILAFVSHQYYVNHEQKYDQ